MLKPWEEIGCLNYGFYRVFWEQSKTLENRDRAKPIPLFREMSRFFEKPCWKLWFNYSWRRKLHERVPIHLHATGHSGQVTLSSIAINSNVGSVEVGTATKHREKIMVTLEKMMILLEQQPLVSLMLLRKSLILITGVEFDPDPVDGTENLHSSSAAISNK